MAHLIAHTIVIVALLTAYVTLSVTGHDGTALLGTLGGYVGGAGVTTVANGQKSGA